MRKDIKEIITINDQKVCRITTPDERFYGKEVKNPITGLPEIKWFPSSTWIKSYWYMSPYLLKWIADKGLTEADVIKKEAGLRGDKIHQASEDIDKGLGIAIDAKYLNKERGEMEELTVEEIDAIKSYADFIDAEKPELITNEMTVFSPEGSDEEYAGTLDRIFGFRTGNIRQIVILDIKSGQSVYKEMHIQVSSYSHADIDYQKLGITDEEWQNRKLAILQVGYRKNKNGYKYTEIPDRYDLFKIAYQTWKEENPDSQPRQKDYPLVIQSQFRKPKEGPSPISEAPENNGKQQSDSQASGDSAQAPVAPKKRKGSANSNGAASSENNRGQVV